MSRPNKGVYFLSMARLVSSRATCCRRSVGCVITNERGHVLSTGYNGVAAGQPHCGDQIVVGYASVPENPRPEHWQDEARFYFDRANSIYPELQSSMKGLVTRSSVGPSTVVDQVKVSVVQRPNACDGAMSPSGTNLDACKAIHAEQNALIQCNNVWAIDTVYVTVSPCVTCTKMLLNTSCKRIVFSELYPQPAAEELWTSSGREWVNASNEELI